MDWIWRLAFFVIWFVGMRTFLNDLNVAVNPVLASTLTALGLVPLILKWTKVSNMKSEEENE